MGCFWWRGGKYYSWKLQVLENVITTRRTKKERIKTRVNIEQQEDGLICGYINRYFKNQKDEREMAYTG